jgi:hypothetical protein
LVLGLVIRQSYVSSGHCRAILVGHPPEIVPVIVWALEDEQKKPTTKSPSTNSGR